MDFKIDENLPREASELFNQAGHDAITVIDQQLGGKPDSTIATVCQQERRVLVTIDTDFADIRIYPPKEFPGLVVVRLKQQDKSHVLEVLQRLISMLPDEPLAEHLWIVEENRIRIRD